MSDIVAVVREFLETLASDTFAICLLAAVLAAVVLAYGFGAEVEFILTILVLGGATALAETTMRVRNKQGPK